VCYIANLQSTRETNKFRELLRLLRTEKLPVCCGFFFLCRTCKGKGQEFVIQCLMVMRDLSRFDILIRDGEIFLLFARQPNEEKSIDFVQFSKRNLEFSASRYCNVHSKCKGHISFLMIATRKCISLTQKKKQRITSRIQK
jgi:hypothetical protein